MRYRNITLFAYFEELRASDAYISGEINMCKANLHMSGFVVENYHLQNYEMFRRQVNYTFLRESMCYH